MWLQHEILAFILGLNPKVSSLAAARWRNATERPASSRGFCWPRRRLPEPPHGGLRFPGGTVVHDLLVHPPHDVGEDVLGIAPVGVGAEPDGAERGDVTADQGSPATRARRAERQNRADGVTTVSVAVSAKSLIVPSPIVLHTTFSAPESV